MTKIGLTSGKFNKRVEVSRKNSQQSNTFSGKAKNSYEFHVVRWCQVFFKKQSVPVEVGGVSDQQEYMFNFRKDYYTKAFDQRCVIDYNNEKYYVKNVDNFNEGLINVTACKKI